MKIILKKDFELLGIAGEIKEVKSGYARNYLIPRGIATVATSSKIKEFEEVKKQKSRKVQKEIDGFKAISAELENLPLHIKAKTADEDKIYGSVTSQMIYDLLVEKGYQKIEKKRIHIIEPIRTIGEHFVEIKLHTNVTAKIKVIVEKEIQEEPAPEVKEEENK